MLEYIHLLYTLNIPKNEIVIYFLRIFADSLLLIFSMFLLLCSTIGTLVFLFFMMKNEQNRSRLLNNLNANLSVYFTLTCALLLIGMFGEITQIQENNNTFMCSVAYGRIFIGFMFQLMFIQITGATFLNHMRPDLYLEISLKWNNLLSIIINLFMASIYFCFSHFNECNLCDLNCIKKENKEKLLIAMILTTICLLIQFGVWIDCQNRGAKQIWKNITLLFVWFQRLFRLNNATVSPENSSFVTKLQEVNHEYVTITTGFITFICLLLTAFLNIIGELLLQCTSNKYIIISNLIMFSFLSTFRIYKNEEMKCFLVTQIKNLHPSKKSSQGINLSLRSPDTFQ